MAIEDRETGMRKRPKAQDAGQKNPYPLALRLTFPGLSGSYSRRWHVKS
jgi:hypothetical protein